MINPAFARIHGYEPHELEGSQPGKVFSPHCMFQRSNSTCETQTCCFTKDTSFETIHMRKDGSPVPVFIHIAVIRDDHATIKYRIINLIDISKRKKAENELIQTAHRLSSLFNTIPDMIWMKDPEGVYLTCNHAFEDLMGAPSGEIIGKKDHDFIENELADFFEKHDREAIEKGGISINEEEIVYRSSGQQGTVLTRRSPVYSPNNQLLGVLGIARDITDKKRTEHEIQQLLRNDTLTGLPNRMFALKRARHILNYCEQTGSKAAMLLIDLDNFKAINKIFGHAIGDATLKICAIKLKELLRFTDTLCRLGSDEFLMILPDSSEYQIDWLIHKIFAAFDAPLHVEQHILSVALSIGAAIYPVHGNSFEIVLQKSYIALNHAKDDGPGTFKLFDEQMNRNTNNHFDLINHLKLALKKQQFLLHYQPQVDLRTNRITGFEVLIRWRHPHDGMITPAQFIPVAEKSGLIVPIGEWIINEACRQGAFWHQEGIQATIAVNISSIQFKRGNLEESIKNALHTSGFNPAFFELELTESVMMHDTEKTLQTVANLKALGICLSIDDFGTGYSSLAYLKRFDVDKLKIDQSFILNVLSNQEDAIIVRTIIQMAENLNLKTIAEGVETADVLKLLREYGCTEVQGYHLAKPMDNKASATFFHAFHKNNEIAPTST